MTDAKRVIVTGATGLIGRRLCQELARHGYAVIVFSRNPEAARREVPDAVEYVAWQPEAHGSWATYVDGAWGVVNLAGGSIYTFGQRQTQASVEAETLNRIQAIKGLVGAMSAAHTPPQVFVCASSVGTYGFAGLSDTVLTEESAPGNDFWGQSSVAWEDAALTAEQIAVRTVVMRFGYVLAMHGHTGLAQQVEQFRRGFGGPVGSGKQWQPWLHIADAVGLLVLALEDSRVQGPLNATAPETVRNRDFARTLGKVVGKPARLATPGWVLRLWLGVTVDTIMYARCVVPKKAGELGYGFQFATLEAALLDLVKG